MYCNHFPLSFGYDPRANRFHKEYNLDFQYIIWNNPRINSYPCLNMFRLFDSIFLSKLRKINKKEDFNLDNVNFEFIIFLSNWSNYSFHGVENVNQV